MTNKKIVVAYDGSPDSKKALKMAIDLAKDLTAAIAVVSVYNIPYGLADGGYYGELSKDYDKLAEKKAAEGKKICEEAGIPVHSEVLQGDPADEIIKYAQQEKVYLILIGTRGLGGFAQLVMGSVAHRVVTYSKIPVLVAK